jgi:hypothetical protein
MSYRRKMQRLPALHGDAQGMVWLQNGLDRLARWA